MIARSRKSKLTNLDDFLEFVRKAKNPSPAKSDDECHIFQVSSAIDLRVFEPFSQDEIQLNKVLTERRAGKILTECAWEFYVECVK